jgi:hypothetical protein
VTLCKGGRGTGTTDRGESRCTDLEAKMDVSDEGPEGLAEKEKKGVMG